MLKHFFNHKLIKGQTYKPLLHKKGKQWIVIGITGLLLAGFGASTATNLNVNADSTNNTNSIQLPTNNQQRANQQNKWNFVMQGVNGNNSEDDKSSIGTGNTGFHYDNATQKVIPNTDHQDIIRYGSYRGMSYTADLNKQSIEFTDGTMPNNTKFAMGYTIHQFFRGNKRIAPDSLITNAKSIKIDSDVDTSHVTDIDDIFAELHNLQSFTLPSNFGKNLTSADFALNGTNTFYKKDSNDNYTSANPVKVDKYDSIVNFKDLGGTYVADKNVMPNSVKQAKAEARAKQADTSIANSYQNSVKASVANLDNSIANSYAKSANQSIATSYRNSVNNSVATANQSLAQSDAQSADKSIEASYKNSVAKSVQAENASTVNSYAQSADKSVATSVKASVARNNRNIANQQKALVEQSVANMNRNTATRDANQTNTSIANSYKNSVANSVAKQNQAIAKQKAQEADQSIANSYKNTEATANQSLANSYAKSANTSIANSVKASVSASVANMNQSIANSYAQSANQSIASSYKNSVATSVKNANASKANSYAKSADASIRASISNSVANQNNATIPESASKNTNVTPAPIMPIVQSSAPVASESAQQITPSSLDDNDTSTYIATKPVQKSHMRKNQIKTVRHINELKVGQVAKYHGKLVKRVRAPKVIKLGRHMKRVHVIGLFVFGHHQIKYEVKIGHHVILINKHVVRKHVRKHLSKRMIHKIMKQLHYDKKALRK